MNYEELVKALRWCDASFLHECDNCLYVKYKHCKDDCMDRMLRDAAAAIEALQALLPKRGKWVHGREIGKEWLYDHWVIYFEDWRCSNCGVVFEQESKPKYHYCPNCGAKMEVQNGQE